MIKFFRHLRQQLLSENKFSKYLLYAIGEIVLVVVGILIALQANEWKEEKQAQGYELKILKENLVQIKDDQKRFNTYIKDIAEAEKSLRYVINYMNSENTHTDSLEFHIKGLSIKNFMVYNKSAYESLKSGGLERISNDSIRTALSQLYETFYPGAEILVNDVLEEEFRSWERQYKLLFLDGYTVASNRYINERIKAPTHDILRDAKFKTLVEHTVSIVSMLKNAYQRYLMPQMTIVIALIESELREK